MIPRVLVGWHVNVRFKLHAHTEETLLRCYTMRTMERGVGVGVGWGGVGWGGMLMFGANCTLIQRKPFYFLRTTECGVGWGGVGC